MIVTMLSGKDYLEGIDSYVHQRIVGLKIKTYAGFGTIYNVDLTNEKPRVWAKGKKFDQSFYFDKFDFVDEPPPLPE